MVVGGRAVGAPHAEVASLGFAVVAERAEAGGGVSSGSDA